MMRKKLILIIKINHASPCSTFEEGKDNDKKKHIKTTQEFISLRTILRRL